MNPRNGFCRPVAEPSNQVKSTYNHSPMMDYTSIAQRVAFRYQKKETKKHKIERLKEVIRSATGLGKGLAEDIADAIVRGREVVRLAIQKGWPIEDGKIVGPRGSLDLAMAKTASPRGCPKCGFVGDEEGNIFDPTFPCPNCGQGGAIVSK